MPMADVKGPERHKIRAFTYPQGRECRGPCAICFFRTEPLGFYSFQSVGSEIGRNQRGSYQTKKRGHQTSRWD